MSLQIQPKALVLFSGGLDSLLAAMLVQEQGVHVTCLHFVSPFFGNPDKIAHWEKIHGLTIKAVDVSDDFTRLLAERPPHGFGSVLNPCIDCKIIMMRYASSLLQATGACCIISGEVLGQRPMSQRRDTLNIIQREAGLAGRLLRPLSALHLEPTRVELDGLVDRNRLLGISGRGRKEQMALAERFGLREIPTPAGGCRLTERENARSYWPVLLYTPLPGSDDFSLANTGRQYWHTPELSNANERPDTEAAAKGSAFWLVIGRNQADNTMLMSLAQPNDLVFKTRDFPGPIALGRYLGQGWPREAVAGAAALMASYSGKAVRHTAKTRQKTAVRIHPGSLDAPGELCMTLPAREPSFRWREFSWEETREGIRAEARRIAKTHERHK